MGPFSWGGPRALPLPGCAPVMVSCVFAFYLSVNYQIHKNGSEHMNGGPSGGTVN